MYDLSSWRRSHGLEGGETNRDAEVVDEHFGSVGATVMGRRMFDEGEGPWGDNPPFHTPVFVLTHDARETVTKEGGTSFTFVTDGVEVALRHAREAAGAKNVAIAGGANTAQQVIKAGRLDELQIHIAPVLLGDGTRLLDQMGPQHIELTSTRVLESPRVTHLRYRIGNRSAPS